MSEDSKHPVSSKTIWLGLVITVAGYLQANLPLIKVLVAAWVSPEHVETIMGAITMALGLGVVVVRFYTTGPVAMKP